MTAATPRRLLLTVAGDVHLKSDRTQRRLRRVLLGNLEVALARRAPSAAVVAGPRGRMMVEVHDPSEADDAAEAAASVFGIYRVVEVERFAFAGLDDLVARVAEWNRPRVAGRRFAARVRRRGRHDWGSSDAERAIGSALLEHSAGVDLTNPEVEVRVEVFGDEAYHLGRAWAGADGLPLGTQEPVLSLLSGGFDSPVAAWMLMRRGSPVDYVHFMMDCSQSDHALAVAFGLWQRWGAGHDALAWVVDFTDVKTSLLDSVDSQHRQVILKQLMFAAADALADRHRYPALVTGEAVGQVSSQTITNLSEIDRACDRTVLRPLAGLTKNEILDWARRAGSHDLSARAKEVCDLATGPVEVAARRRRLERAAAQLPADLVSRALAERRVIRLADWSPGVELVEVHPAAPTGFTTVGGHQADPAPGSGPVAVAGPDAARRASRLQAAGHRVVVVEGALERELRRAG